MPDIKIIAPSPTSTAVSKSVSTTSWKPSATATSTAPTTSTCNTSSKRWNLEMALQKFGENLKYHFIFSAFFLDIWTIGSNFAMTATAACFQIHLVLPQRVKACDERVHLLLSHPSFGTFGKVGVAASNSCESSSIPSCGTSFDAACVFVTVRVWAYSWTSCYQVGCLVLLWYVLNRPIIDEKMREQRKLGTEKG